MRHHLVWHGVRVGVACFLALPLAGCATRNTAALRHDLATHAPCCSDFAGMTFVPLGEEPVDVRLGAGSPVFAFAEGRSYFAAFRLPDAGRRGLVVETFQLGAINSDETAFMPRLVFLNADHKAVDIARDVPVRFEGGSSGLDGTFFVGRVSVPREAAYVVAYTTDAPHVPVEVTYNGHVWQATSVLSGHLRMSMSR